MGGDEAGAVCSIRAVLTGLIFLLFDIRGDRIIERKSCRAGSQGSNYCPTGSRGSERYPLVRIGRRGDAAARIEMHSLLRHVAHADLQVNGR